MFSLLAGACGGSSDPAYSGPQILQISVGGAPTPTKPEAAGNSWSYSCSDSSVATESRTDNGFYMALHTFKDTLTYHGSSLVVIDANDAQADNVITGYVIKGQLVVVPISVDLPLVPTLNQTYSFPDGTGGTARNTYLGLGTASTPAGKFNTEVFRLDDKGQTVTTNQFAHGQGIVESDFATGVICKLTSFTLH